MQGFGSRRDRSSRRAGMARAAWGRFMLRAVVGVFVVVLLPSPLAAQRPKQALPDPKAGYSWQDAARKAGLDATDIEQVAKQKVLVSQEAFKQVFTPYIRSELPLFVTSDSVLNAYHVLLEESILRLENANLRRLPEVLRTVWQGLPKAEKGLKGKPELVAAARTRSAVVIGTATRLLGGEDIKPEPKIAAWIDEEVKRVTAASGRDKAAWLGPPDPGFVALDYTRYKPRGFYTKSEALSRYFRAVSWLQSIPFRISKDEELLAILILGRSIDLHEAPDFDQRERIGRFFGTFERVFGMGDDGDIRRAAGLANMSLTFGQDANGQDADSIQRARNAIESMSSARPRDESLPQINDQLAFPPEDPTKSAEPSFRILAASRTPDAVLFGRTTDIRRFKPRMPTGIEVAAALGSQLARSCLAADPQGKALVAEIDGAKPLFAGRSLYAQYLDCVGALVDKPEPDAPRFMSTDAWQIKSCQTVLGGWAQLRHTWALQAKQNVMYMGGTLPPPGFVEPVPEFYSRLARLAEETHELLKEAGALAIDPQDIAADIRKGIPIMRRFRAAGEAAPGKGKDGEPEMPPLEDLSAMQKVMLLSVALAPDKPRASSQKEFEDSLRRLEKLAGQLEKEGLPASGKVAEVIRATEIDMDNLWREFARLCRRLESLAHKQLRGVAFSEEENRFVGILGERLAATMLYGGTSFLTPRDDAPRAIDVYANPNKPAYLEVAIGRPRAIYVLYPYQGAEILCRGAVMPYFEFPHDARLTDAEWIALLSSPKRPQLPQWASPIYSARGQGRPEVKGDEH